MTIRLEAGSAVAEIDAAAGGRLARLQLAGMNILADDHSRPLLWGMYPMLPWAGRLREGKFWYQGKVYRQPLTMPPHAIHGTAWGSAWTEQADGRLLLDPVPGWPFPASAVQRFELSPDCLRISMSLHAQTGSFPASMGWHPCFATHLSQGEPAQLAFKAESVYQCDAAGIPSGVLMSPGPGPWDDCFTHLVADPVIEWPGALRLTLSSDCSHWICYNQLQDVLCVEPVTAPPNALNLTKFIVEPGKPLSAYMELRWQLL